MKTTCIGAYPKPSFLHLPDWFNLPGGTDTTDPTSTWQAALDAMGDDAGQIIADATKEVVQDQVKAGVDIPSDGEVQRENYIHYHCRHIAGIDFANLSERKVRDVYYANLPTITERVRARDTGFLARDWKLAQSFTDRPVKITMPGPMTISDTTANDHYESDAQLAADLSDALNEEVLALAHAGCPVIQVDEPVFARKPDAALEYGIENLERIFRGVPRSVSRTMHMCCGYPSKLDVADYPKAEPSAYFELAKAVNESCVDAVSIEDAHRHNDLSLLDLLPDTKVILGVVAIAKSRVESVEEIRERLVSALGHIEPERLIAAPDCGLGFLGRELSLAKLRNLCEAAHSL